MPNINSKNKLDAAAQAQKLASDCAEHMYSGDTASQWLGISILDVDEGQASAKMVITENMLNGHKTCHGGILFSLADSAFAFACNSQNHAAVAAGCHIDFLLPAFEGDELIATATQIHQGKRSGIYHITIVNQKQQTIALFKGNSARIKRSVLPEAQDTEVQKTEVQETTKE